MQVLLLLGLGRGIEASWMDASSDLWKAKNIFYPTAIREATSSSSVATGDQPEEGVTQSKDLQVRSEGES